MEIAAVQSVYSTVCSVPCWYNCQIQKEGGLSSKSIKSAGVFDPQRPLNWELQWILWLPLMALLPEEHRYTFCWHMKHLKCAFVKEKQFWSRYRPAVTGGDHQGSSLKRTWLHHTTLSQVSGDQSEVSLLQAAFSSTSPLIFFLFFYVSFPFQLQNKLLCKHPIILMFY